MNPVILIAHKNLFAGGKGVVTAGEPQSAQPSCMSARDNLLSTPAQRHGRHPPKSFLRSVNSNILHYTIVASIRRYSGHVFPPPSSPTPLATPTLFSTAGRTHRTVTTISAVGREQTMSSPSTPPPFRTLKERTRRKHEIKRIKFIAIACPISDERSAHSFLVEVQDPRATHNCRAYKIGDQYRCNDDGEPSGTLEV